MKKLSSLILFVCLSIGLSPALKAENEEALALSREIIALSRVDSAMEQIIPAVMQQQKAMLQQKFGANADAEKLAKAEKMMEAFMSEMSADFPKLLDKVAMAYAGKFSVSDLTALRDFYASDVGQRFAQGSLELSTEMAQYGQEWAIAVLTKAQAKLAEAD